MLRYSRQGEREGETETETERERERERNRERDRDREMVPFRSATPRNPLHTSVTHNVAKKDEYLL